MKGTTMRRKIAAVVLVSGVFVLGFAGPASAADAAPRGSIVDVAVAASGGGTPDSNSRDFDILIQAVTATGLAPVLADLSTDYTLFAPTDQAFKLIVKDATGAFPASEAEALTTITTMFTLEQISNVLLYHVVPGASLGPVQVLTAGSLTMANGGVVKPRAIVLVDENTSFTNPRLVLTGLNIKADNGVIHVINRVLVPGTI